MKISSICLGLFCLGILTACPGQTITQVVNIPPSANPSAPPTPAPTPAPTTQAVIQVIHDNANALNGNDKERFMATFHTNSELLNEGFYQRLHTTYRTRYNIVEAKIQSQSSDSATAIVKRRTTDYAGTVDQDVLYSLRIDSDGKWKIVEMAIQSQRFI